MANTYGIENRLPLFKGEKVARIAWREHIRDLIQFYAKKRKMNCGHYSRHQVCYKCKQIAYEAAIQDFEKIKARQSENRI